MYQNILQQLAKRIDNERRDLSFKGSSKDKRVTGRGGILEAENNSLERWENDRQA